MWRDTGRPVELVFLDARACLPLLVFVVYWSWMTFYIAATGVVFFSVISWAGLTRSLDIEDDPARLCRALSSRNSSLEAAEVRMTAIDAVRLKTLNPAYVSRVVRELLIEADRDILVEDGPRRDLVEDPVRCRRSGGWAFAAVPGRRRGDLARRHGTWLRTRAQARSRRAHVVADRGDPSRGLLLRSPVGHGGDRGGHGRSRGDGARSRTRVRRGDGAHEARKAIA